MASVRKLSSNGERIGELELLWLTLAEEKENGDRRARLAVDVLGRRLIA